MSGQERATRRAAWTVTARRAEIVPTVQAQFDMRFVDIVGKLTDVGNRAALLIAADDLKNGR